MQSTVLVRTLGAALMAGLLAMPAQAQTAATYSDLPQTLRIDAGGFRIAADTKLKYNLGGQPADAIDFENDTSSPPTPPPCGSMEPGAWAAGIRCR